MPFSTTTIDTIFFVLSYDATLLTLDPTDADDDNIPDSVTANLPDGYRLLVDLQIVNGEGQLEVLIENRSPDGVVLPSGDLLLLAFDVTWVPTPDTEISLTYEANRDRGFIFIESRNLAPRFQDRMSDTAE